MMLMLHFTQWLAENLDPRKFSFMTYYLVLWQIVQVNPKI